MELLKYLDTFKALPTPFYFYDMELLRETFRQAQEESRCIPLSFIHLAMKANSHPQILQTARDYGFGIDAVSGGEILKAIEAGIPGPNIVFAGVGKTDREIIIGLKNDILCFNVESIPEIEVINHLAGQMGKIARITLRVNPDVDAHTHKNITTGLEENKFGIDLCDILPTIKKINSLPHLNYYGLHFHIGSQILNMDVFQQLSIKINSLQNALENAGITTNSINVGGGLGVDYTSPEKHPIPCFHEYFQIFYKFLKLRPHQEFHCELGRSLTAQSGALISQVVFIKEGHVKKFAILDAGFTDLIRPALYQANHKIINLSSSTGEDIYDVVGPICESTDVFTQDIHLPLTHRGDLMAILSAGAYGHVMASEYNCRPLIKEYTSDDLK